MLYLKWCFIFTCLVPLFLQANALSPDAATNNHEDKPQFFNIAHGTNLKESVDFALKSGANALEMDLQFDENNGGMPTVFYHGIPCDCTCAPVVLLDEKLRDKRTASLCKQISSPCTKKTKAEDLLQHIAKNYSDNISFIYIDGKVSDFKNKTNLISAGKNVFNLIKKELFDRGYEGQIVFGVPYKTDAEYLTSINEELKKPDNSSLQDRIFFTVDWEVEDALGTLKFMADAGLQKNMVYSVGHSICVPYTYYDNIKIATKYLTDGLIGLNIIWTLDRSSSIEKYIKLGVNAVMSNSPEKVHDIATRLGYTMSPKNRIAPNKK